MGRPMSFDPQEKLQIAMRLFWQQGYEATSVQQLIRAMQINRNSLYHCFGDKNTLYHLALDHYLKVVVEPLIEPLLEDDATVSSVVLYLQRLRTGLTGPGGSLGCFVQNAGMEMAAADAAVQHKVDCWYAELERLLRRCLANSAHHGTLKPEVDPANAAQYLVTVLQGMLVLHRSASNHRRDLNAFNFLIAQIENWEA